jgi:hypothetical protein
MESERCAGSAYIARRRSNYGKDWERRIRSVVNEGKKSGVAWGERRRPDMRVHSVSD